MLEKQLDAKQALELEIEQLRGNLNVMRHIKYEGDVDVLNEVDLLHKAMREKERELGDLEAINQTLVVQERKRNDELQDARKELVNVSCILFVVHVNEFYLILFSQSLIIQILCYGGEAQLFLP